MVCFSNILPPDRLGVSHPTLQSFYSAAYNGVDPEIIKNDKKTKEYTLVVVTESKHERILLGMKNRGFGTGFYNSFGGKVDKEDKSVAEAACRELLEETNISVPLRLMEERFIGRLCFTFEDDEINNQMLCHLFHIDVLCEPKRENKSDSTIGAVNVITIDPYDIKPPDDNEITPKWFDDWYSIPLNNMFADDSVWLTEILSAYHTSQETKRSNRFNGFFHFASGGVDTNTILHRHIQHL